MGSGATTSSSEVSITRQALAVRRMAAQRARRGVKVFDMDMVAGLTRG